MSTLQLIDRWKYLDSLNVTLKVSNLPFSSLHYIFHSLNSLSGVVVWQPLLANEYRIHIQHLLLSYSKFRKEKTWSSPRSNSTWRCIEAGQRLIYLFLIGVLDAPDLLERVCFRVPSFSTHNLPFFIPSHTTSFVSAIFWSINCKNIYVNQYQL